MPVKKHTENLVLYKHYTPEEYPHYENYNAINVNTYTDIPYDYEGVMGVPITFLDKFNPEQFDILEYLINLINMLVLLFQINFLKIQYSFLNSFSLVSIFS